MYVAQRSSGCGAHRLSRSSSSSELEWYHCAAPATMHIVVGVTSNATIYERYMSNLFYPSDPRDFMCCCNLSLGLRESVGAYTF